MDFNGMYNQQYGIIENDSDLSRTNFSNDVPNGDFVKIIR
jgi:hypothetical protein